MAFPATLVRMLEQKITLINKLGLHARAAAKFTDTAGRFSSRMTVKKGAQGADAKSILDVLMLGAPCGTELEFIVEGEDEQAAMAAMTTLIQDRFGEEE